MSLGAYKKTKQNKILSGGRYHYPKLQIMLQNIIFNTMSETLRFTGTRKFIH